VTQKPSANAGDSLPPSSAPGQIWSPDEKIHIDTRFHPLVVTIIRDSWDTPDLEFMLAQFEQLFAAQKRYALIFDTTRAYNGPGVSQRKLVAAWDSKFRHETERWNVGTAVVFQSTVVRGTLTAMSWLAVRKIPEVYVANISEAGRFCAARLREAKIQLPAQTRRYLASIDAATDEP
jgi:hypothetical protein